MIPPETESNNNRGVWENGGYIFYSNVKSFTWLSPHNHHMSFDTSLCSYCHLSHRCLYQKKLYFDFFDLLEHISRDWLVYGSSTKSVNLTFESILHEDNAVSLKRFFYNKNTLLGRDLHFLSYRKNSSHIQKRLISSPNTFLKISHSWIERLN